MRTPFIGSTWKSARQRIDILASEFQCYHPRRHCASRLSWKGGTLQNRGNLASEDSFVATSATEGHSQKCLASWTGKHWETNGGSSDGRTRSRFEISGYSTWRTSARWGTQSETVQWKTGACNFVSSKDAPTAEFQSTFTEESKLMIHTLGIVENIELCHICHNIRCPHCVKYLTEGTPQCDCGTCLIPSEEARTLKKARYDVLAIPFFPNEKGSKPGSTAWSIGRSESRPSSPRSFEQVEKEELQIHSWQIWETRFLPHFAN